MTPHAHLTVPASVRPVSTAPPQQPSPHRERHGPARTDTQRFPLAARLRPACLPLPERVRGLAELVGTATKKGDQGLASAVHDQVALTDRTECAQIRFVVPVRLCGIDEIARHDRSTQQTR